MVMRIRELGGPDFHRLTEARDEEIGFDAIIAIHDTTRGPALGGCRINDYYTRTEHMADAMRLSKAMTKKNKAADIPRGGGKMVVNHKGPMTADLAHSIGAFVNFVNKDGLIFQTGGDMNCGENELKMISKHTHYCYYNPHGLSNSGETTAFGVYTAIKYLADQTNVINIEGIGKVGSSLALMLQRDGYKIRVTDIREEWAREFAYEHGFEHRPLSELKMMDGVYAPCGVGRTVDLEFTLNSKASLICGGANNQIDNRGDVEGGLLAAGIKYAPDYIVNMGGVLHIYHDMENCYDGPVGIENPAIVAQIKDRILGCPHIRGLKNA